MTPGARTRRVAAAALIVTAGTRLRAATVDVVVREREGGPVAGQGLVVHPPVAAGEFLWAIPAAKRPVGETGADGRCTFAGLPPGTYTVTLRSLVDPNLVDPADNPLAPAPVFTVAKDDDRLTVPVDLWRGVPVTAQITVDRGDIPRARCVFRSLDTGRSAAASFDLAGYAEKLLVPGTYEASIEIPDGLLITDLVVNGQPQPHDAAMLDLTADPRRQSIAWALSAPCTLGGQLTADSGPACPLDVVATLIEPGRWYEAAARRGGARFDRVRGRSNPPDCFYGMRLPSGTWRVAPEGDRLLSSDPKEAIAHLEPGDDGVANFKVDLAPDRGMGSALRVSVRAPDGRWVRDAVVEAWPFGDESKTAPAATASTSSFGEAVLRGLAAGDYRVVAGHAEFLEADAEVRGFDPRETRDARAAITLREGAKIVGHAVDDKGLAVRDVEMAVERIGDPPPTRLASDEIARRKTGAVARTDTTGYASVRGLYAGRYRITPRAAGEIEGRRFVRVAEAGKSPAASIEVEVPDAAVVALDLPVRPAASLEGTVACADGGTLPPLAAIRVFAAEGPHPDPWSDPELSRSPVLSRDSAPLTGPQLDRFRAGPLPPGSYRLAVRPGGFAYWTWAPAEVAPRRGATLQATATEAAPAGVVTADCGPVVMIVPEIRSREAPPDLQEATVRVRAETSDESLRKLDPRVEAEDDRVFVRGLPSRSVKLEVTIASPYLAPPSMTLPVAELPLKRGELRTVGVPFEAVGGAIRVVGRSFAAARITGSGGKPRIEAAAEGGILFAGVPPGRYRVEVCPEPTCSGTVRGAGEVSVVAKRTVRLEPDSRTP